MTSDATPTPSSALTTQREVERKYDIPEGAGTPDLTALGGGLRAGEPVTETLVAEYVDTPDLAILGARSVLRRRTGGGDAGWHLKKPREGDSRVELHAPVGAPRRIPPELRAEFASFLGDSPVLPLVEITTVRTTTEVSGGGPWTVGGRRGEDDALAALICEDQVRARVLRIGEDREHSWREFEVELADGADPAIFNEIEAVLFAAGLTPSVHTSKMVRSIEGVTPTPPPAADGTVGDAVLAAIAQRFGEFQVQEALARADAPDAVHQARVALRRLRSLFKVFSRVFDEKQVRGLRDELRWAGQVLGAPRDAEVLRELLADEFASLAEDETALDVAEVRRRVEGWIEERHARALAEFLAEVDSPRWDALHDDFVSFLIAPPLTDASRVRASGAMRRATREAIEGVSSRTDRARRKPKKIERWHDVRKAVKAVRYSYEALEGLPGAKAGGERKQWKKLAKAFGEVQDGALLDEELTAFIARAKAEVKKGVELPGETIEVLETARTRIRDRRDADLADARDRLDDLT